MPNTQPHSLAHISLRWMVQECFRTGTDIRFHTESLKNIGLDTKRLEHEYEAYKQKDLKTREPEASETQEAAQRQEQGPVGEREQMATAERAQAEAISERDSLCTIHDELSLKWWWWIVEFFYT